MLGWEESPLQQDPMSSQAADPRSRDRLQRQKGSPGVGDILSDVSGEEGDGAHQPDDTPILTLCPKCTLSWTFGSPPACSQG